MENRLICGLWASFSMSCSQELSLSVAFQNKICTRKFKGVILGTIMRICVLRLAKLSTNCSVLTRGEEWLPRSWSRSRTCNVKTSDLLFLNRRAQYSARLLSRRNMRQWMAVVRIDDCERTQVPLIRAWMGVKGRPLLFLPISNANSLRIPILAQWNISSLSVTNRNKLSWLSKRNRTSKGQRCTKFTPILWQNSSFLAKRLLRIAKNSVKPEIEHRPRKCRTCQWIKVTKIRVVWLTLPRERLMGTVQRKNLLNLQNKIWQKITHRKNQTRIWSVICELRF